MDPGKTRKDPKFRPVCRLHGPEARQPRLAHESFEGVGENLGVDRGATISSHVLLTTSRRTVSHPGRQWTQCRESQRDQARVRWLRRSVGIRGRWGARSCR